MKTTKAMRDRIWETAYAAAFVLDFDNLLRVTRSTQTNAEGAFDNALLAISAERAVTIADEAVKKLKEWY